MGVVKGQLDYQNWQKGGKLTLKRAILAMCYMCNGFEESADDCKGSKSCPLYQYSPSGRR